MNLHSIVAGAISAVNPMLTGTIKISIGYGKAPNAAQVPLYAAPKQVQVQVQPLSSDDLKKLDGMNIQGHMKAMYLNGENLQAASRPDRKGGDLITLPDGSVWLVTQVLEDWNISSGWMKSAVTLQMKK